MKAACHGLSADRWFIWSLCQRAARCCVSSAAPSIKSSVFAECTTGKREKVQTNCSCAVAVMWSDGVGFRGRMSNRKRKNEPQKQYEAVSSRRLLASCSAPPCVRLYPAYSLALDVRPSQLQEITACVFYWSLANLTVSSEGPNQTHKSCCSFSFTRRTSRLLPLEVTVSCLSQSTLLLSFRETVFFCFCFLCVALVLDRRPIER